MFGILFFITSSRSQTTESHPGKEHDALVGDGGGGGGGIAGGLYAGIVRDYDDNRAICALVQEYLSGHLSTSLEIAFGGVMENPLCQLVHLTQSMQVPGNGGIVHTQVLRKFTSSPPWVRFHRNRSLSTSDSRPDLNKS
ncbi:unnamed protein product [Heligmosomoides polygyrus]|uniref:Secreted protein n=1 Tax=Heligmosomoides polygyrus TaxID=6339 RepID=A0A183GTQ2_HELPZ|nr:unnamed protein product [Heligmosomoides polygyrus]